MTDNQLIDLFKHTNSFKYFYKLKTKYELLIWTIVYKLNNKSFSMSYDLDDIYILCIYWFYKLCLKYNSKKGITFSSYIWIFLEKRVLDEIRKIITKKNDVNNFATSFDEKWMYVEKKNDTLIEERIEKLRSFLNGNLLSKFEKRIVNQLLYDQDIVKTANNLKITKKALYNKIYIIRNKLSLKLESRK